jgi:hypothetical protein
MFSSISFLSSVDTVNYLWRPAMATYPAQWEKYIRRDSYKLSWVASRAILGKARPASQMSRAFFAESKR